MRMSKGTLEVYTLFSDKEDVQAILDELGMSRFANEITGVLVDTEPFVNEVYEMSADIYLTESDKPWDISAEWERPAYYADEIPEELDLQDIGDVNMNVLYESFTADDRRLQLRAADEINYYEIVEVDTREQVVDVLHTEKEFDNIFPYWVHLTK